MKLLRINIKKVILGVFFTLTFINFGFGQNHFIILIDGGAKTRSHENNPDLKKLLLDSIPEIIFNKGITINDEIVKANENDFFTVAFYGLLSHRKIKHYGDKDYLQIKTLFPALKNVSIKDDYIHKTEINYSVVNSKKIFVQHLKKEIRKQDTYWYGFSTISDYALYEILNSNNKITQKTIVIILIKDIEFNSQGAASEISFIKEYLKDYNKTAGVIDKTLPANYHKIEMNKIKSGNINAYFYNLYPKIQDTISQDFTNNIIEKIEYNKKNSETSLLQYSIVLNDFFKQITNKHKSIIDSISYSIYVDDKALNSNSTGSKIKFYLPISDTLDKCKLSLKKVSLKTNVLLKDTLTGKKWLHFDNTYSPILPKYPTCQYKYWIIRGLLVFLLLFLIWVLRLYYILRFKTTDIYYDIENIGSYKRVYRNDKNKEINLEFSSDAKIWCYYKPSNSRVLKFISKISHKNIQIITSKNKVFSIKDLPIAINLSKGESMAIKQSNKNILTIKN